ncbi:MAG: 16S rRNA (cytidine(1402)-2'-O)-methyltransferase [Candidatus Krumholzibacteriota bacterium]|nr:16S rRNA (cytidine(1402)-2'-O)-methyltransferase [Candidatus Krumholzibacteriota bacterium]
MMMRKYQFYFIGTPIGNLGDLSSRAVDLIGSVDLLLAEDTRKTMTLLKKNQLGVTVRSYHDHNKEKVTPSIIKKLKEGATAALVSDAGMPGISDPGYHLVRKLIEEDIEYTVIPGPSAVTTALLLSGFPPDRFSFYGYLPRKKGAREKIIKEAGENQGTSIFFESPYRIIKALQAVASQLGEREVAVAREMTKLHEEVLRGSASDIISLIGDRKLKGEITLVLRGRGRSGRTAKTDSVDRE